MKISIEMNESEANDLMRYAIRALEEATTANERREVLLRFIGQAMPETGGRHER